MRKIPYGRINFAEIIEDNYIYVDKTKYIEKLEEQNNKTLFYLRPGRFGKSLFTNVLDYYYAIDQKEKFDTLFDGLYIKENPTPNKNNYYVLNFDFSGIDNNDGWNIDKLMEVFNGKVALGIKEFNVRYKTDFQVDMKLTPAQLIGEFFVYFSSLNLNHKIYLIIDEYDNFTNGILKGNAEKFLGVLTEEGFIKGFYARIKEAIKDGVVERFFATGKIPISLDSMTTGFNIATDITRDRGFVAMVGFTEQETMDLIKEVLPDKTKQEQQEVFDTMEKYYDGYRFSEFNEEHTFNSTLVMYYLNNYVQEGEPPAKLIDINIAANFSKLGNILTLKGNSCCHEILTDAIQGNEMQGSIIDKFELSRMPIDDQVIQSMLFYFGYLTIKEQQLGLDVTYKIPNYVMEGIYNDYFSNLLYQEGIRVDTSRLRQALYELALEGKIGKLCAIVEDYLRDLGNISWQRYDEKYVQSYMHSILRLNDLFNVYLEYNVRDNQYIDVAVFKRENTGVKYQAIIELKYIKKEEAKTEDQKQKAIQEKRKKAIEQIEAYSQDERLPHDDMKKFIVIYVGQKLELLEEVHKA